jgi:hypothetical protein
LREEKVDVPLLSDTVDDVILEEARLPSVPWVVIVPLGVYPFCRAGFVWTW